MGQSPYVSNEEIECQSIKNSSGHPIIGFKRESLSFGANKRVIEISVNRGPVGLIETSSGITPLGSE